jgi:hypothetical protein
MPTPVPDLIYGALAEIRVARGGDVVRAEDQALCLGFLNEVLERLAVTPHALYATQGLAFQLVPGAVSATLGPTGTCITPRRPVRIQQVWVGVSGTTVPVDLQTTRWIIDHFVAGVTAQVPASLSYNPTWPNGELNFWPVPSTAAPLSLSVDVEILAVAITDTIDLPPGYSELLRLWTAKKAAPSFAREFSTASQAALTECLGEIFGTNIARVPDLDTRDGGVPGGRGGTYDAQTGRVS